MIVTQSQKQCNGKTVSLAFELPPLVLGAAAPPVEAKLPEITFTIVSVTPEMARGWLPRNFVRNRIARPRRVERYKRLIADGDWRLTHQGIAFDRFGVLVDGQHRVLAISQMPEGTSVPLREFGAGPGVSALEAVQQAKKEYARADGDEWARAKVLDDIRAALGTDARGPGLVGAVSRLVDWHCELENAIRTLCKVLP